MRRRSASRIVSPASVRRVLMGSRSRAPLNPVSRPGGGVRGPSGGSKVAGTHPRSYNGKRCATGRRPYKTKGDPSMSVATFEGIVKDGRIQLSADVHLPDKTSVYVVVPGLEATPATRMISPRLAHPEQGTDFKMEVIDADI